MTDPDERTINRALSLLGTEVANDEEAVQDHREAARAALHRLFRDRRRLENENAGLREELERWRNGPLRGPDYAELARLREEIGRLKDRVSLTKEYDAQQKQAEIDRLREENEEETQARITATMAVETLTKENARLREGRQRDDEYIQELNDELAFMTERYNKAVEKQGRFYDELARLREENENVKRWFREAEGHRDYWKGREQKRTAALEAELARLREERDAARTTLEEKMRLMIAERDRLREALEEIVQYEESDPSYAPLTGSYEIARNALGEIT